MLKGPRGSRLANALDVLGESWTLHEFEIGDELFHATIDDGRVELHDGPGRLTVEGDRGAIRACLAIFAPARPGGSRATA